MPLYDTDGAMRVKLVDGGAGGAANPNPGADYATSGRQDSGLAAFGAPADAAATDAAGNFSIIALLKRIRDKLSTPSSNFSVEKANGSGTTASLLSAATTAARRTIMNTSAATIEVGPQGFAYGDGWPIPAGQTFTFDDTGRTTGAIYALAANGAAWSARTMRY